MQTNYDLQSVNNISVKGGLADAGNTNKVTGVSAVEIEFGLGLVVLSTGVLALPSGGSDIFAGVAMMKHKSQSNSSGDAKYAVGEAISLVKKGRIWVYSEVAVDPTLPVYCRYTANTGPTRPVGNFLVSVDSSKAFLVNGARWVSKTAAAGLAILELNLPA